MSRASPSDQRGVLCAHLGLRLDHSTYLTISRSSSSQSMLYECCGHNDITLSIREMANLSGKFVGTDNRTVYSQTNETTEFTTKRFAIFRSALM